MAHRSLKIKSTHSLQSSWSSAFTEHWHSQIWQLTSKWSLCFSFLPCLVNWNDSVQGHFSDPSNSFPSLSKQMPELALELGQIQCSCFPEVHILPCLFSRHYWLLLHHQYVLFFGMNPIKPARVGTAAALALSSDPSGPMKTLVSPATAQWNKLTHFQSAGC